MSRILIVEPDNNLSDTLSKFLTARSYKVDQAYTSQEAVLKADKHKPDLVVLELAMPKNNGIAFLQEFRSYVDWINVPIIIYSLISQEETGISDTDWKKSGVDTYLYKSTSTLASLLNHIQRILNNYETV